MRTKETKSMAFTFLRISIGIMLALHGLTKLLAGNGEWIHLGAGFQNIVGIEIPQLAMGLFAAILQTVGGLCIAAGMLFRIAILMYAATMLVAFIVLIKAEEPFSHFSHSLEILIILASFYLIGPGKHTLLNIKQKPIVKIKS